MPDLHPDTATRTQPDPDTEATHREALPSWVLRVWAVMVVFGVITLVRSSAVGIPLKDPHGHILRSKIAYTLVAFTAFVLIEAATRVPRRGWSATALVTAVRERWTRRRLLLAGLAVLAYHLVYFCYHNLKSWDVFIAPHDQMLESVDHWLFLGHSPAVLLHDLLGQHAAAWVLMVWYESFPTLEQLAIPAALVFAPRMREAYVGVASGLWIWILGTASYYAIPTLGPFNAAPRDFSGLPHMMIQDTQARYLAQRNDLLAHPHAPDAFAQISAFASLHVGVTTTILLMFRYYGMRRSTRAMTVFLIGTIVATIYLGWHFAVDDIAGLFIGWLSVRLGRWTIHPPARAAREVASGRPKLGSGSQLR
ncbi:phosphatase PAP2 family protein [Nocardioides panaciterrulae]|uniref:Inositolphosphotransferase Aur1/Ipt1 domain-containing protein n=1 Tax=Nocardioides panaciterrulae TaxID=661492 RepID=A0A7Y9E4P3_9ACTN|nr:phosphatase PAP2 family protein [Nocardioides panaciterrulae]NYD41143.1 hypothetical protein [Nocardioides panaciterrulae]